MCCVFHNLLMLRGLCPDDIRRMTVCGMVWTVHAANVAPNHVVDILPISRIVGINVEATIENLKAIHARLSCCYNELHNVFSVFWLKCVLAKKLAQKGNLQAVNLLAESVDMQRTHGTQGVLA